MVALDMFMIVIIIWAFYVYYVERQRRPGMVMVREQNQ